MQSRSDPRGFSLLAHCFIGLVKCPLSCSGPWAWWWWSLTPKVAQKGVTEREEVLRLGLSSEGLYQGIGIMALLGKMVRGCTN